MSELFDIPLTAIDGSPTSLGEYRGSPMLIVNVASKCGLTPQYAELQKLFSEYRDRGLVVLGFPANNFAGQEPGSNEEIQQFCETSYGVEFPMFSKISVKGEDQHPLYKTLTEAAPESRKNPEGKLRSVLDQHGLGPEKESDIMWNFEKFLVGKDGKVVARFAPDVTPTDPQVIQAVENELGT